jgi:hypothetical protein
VTILALLNIIFENRQPLWTTEFEQWIRESRRFRAFAETYRDKIRKKLRNAQDDAALKDLYFELETAYRLLQDERMLLEYEKLAQLKQRAPDFTATYRVNTLFNVEVTRLRFPSESKSIDSDEIERVKTRKLLDGVCDKLGQMLPSTINVLLMIAGWEVSQAKLLTTINTLRMRAETKQDSFFTRQGFQDSRDFLKHFQRLSIVFCRGDQERVGVIYINPLARHPIPKELLNALQRLWS